MSFEKSATKGVGGPCRMFFYEEAGIAPTLDTTFEFIRPALNAGDITTGLFIAAGSVGKLKDCEPLKELTLNPRPNGIEPVTTNLMDETGLIGVEHSVITTSIGRLEAKRTSVNPNFAGLLVLFLNKCGV